MLKIKTALLIVFCLLVLSLQVISAQSLSLQDTTIIIDPGHPSYLFPSAWYNKYKSIK